MGRNRISCAYLATVGLPRPAPGRSAPYTPAFSVDLRLLAGPPRSSRSASQTAENRPGRLGGTQRTSTRMPVQALDACRWTASRPRRRRSSPPARRASSAPGSPRSTIASVAAAGASSRHLLGRRRPPDRAGRPPGARGGQAGRCSVAWADFGWPEAWTALGARLADVRDAVQRLPHVHERARLVMPDSDENRANNLIFRALAPSRLGRPALPSEAHPGNGAHDARPVRS